MLSKFEVLPTQFLQDCAAPVEGGEEKNPLTCWQLLDIVLSAAAALENA